MLPKYSYSLSASSELGAFAVMEESNLFGHLIANMA